MFARTSLSRTRLAAQHVSCSRRISPASTGILNHRRTLVTETIHSLSEGFLDLAIALPFPESIPAYSGTIILVTVVTRLALTVPFSVWAKQRQWRAEELVVPELAQEKPQILQQVWRDMQKDGFRGDKDALAMEHSKRAQPLLKARQKALFKKYHCSPVPTMVIAPLTQLPVFVLTSLAFSHAAQPPTVLDGEAFWTLTSLAHTDPTYTLPIVVGLLTLANVESAHWFVSAAARERQTKVAEWAEKRRAKGEVVVEPRKIINTTLRTMSVCRILIAAMVPGAVQIYWVTSSAFGLIQSWVLDWIHRWRRRSRPVVLPPPPEPKTVPSPNSRVISPAEADTTMVLGPKKRVFTRVPPRKAK